MMNPSDVNDPDFVSENVFRIAMLNADGDHCWLTDHNKTPKINTFKYSKKIKFLANAYPTHTHTWSTERRANNAIATIPFSKIRAKLFAVESRPDKIVDRIFYRFAIKDEGKPLMWLREDESWDQLIWDDTVLIDDIMDAFDFMDTFSARQKDYIKLVKCYDYGPPDWPWDYEFVTRRSCIYCKTEFTP